MSEKIDILLLDEKSIEAQLKIHRAAFGAEGVSITKEYWIKKHYQNPLGNSLIFGASIDGNIVGMNAYMPMEYEYRGEKHKFLQSCESGVLPECQGRGIWGKVVRYALKYIADYTNYEAVIGFPNYITSYPGFNKMGWLTTNDMENYLMVNNVNSFAKIFSARNTLIKILSRGIFIQRLFLIGKSNLTIEPCEAEETIWDERPEIACRSHTPELLNWKKSYLGTDTICIKKNNVIVASCIYHLDKYNDIPIIKLERIATNGNVSYKKAFVALLKYFKKNYPEVAFVRLWATQDSSIRPVIKQLMFMKSGHRNPFIISNSNSILYDKKWDLSFYDLD